MNDEMGLAQKWDNYFFFGGEMPSLVEGVAPIKIKVLKNGLEPRMLTIQETLADIYTALDRLDKATPIKERKSNEVV